METNVAQDAPGRSQAPAVVPAVVHGVEGVRQLVGRELGPSSWVEVTPQKVQGFADATGDQQWIHVDRERAAAGPFGGPIAHGYLTLSLTPVVLTEILRVEGFSLVVNYGCDRVRFPAPVPVGARVRATAAIGEVSEIDGGVQLGVTLTYRAQDAGKPVCVATVVIRYYA